MTDTEETLNTLHVLSALKTLLDAGVTYLRSQLTLHDVIQYLEILGLGFGLVGGCLWYLTRNETANREKDAKNYEEIRRYGGD